MDLRTIFKNRLGQNPALSIMGHGKNSFGSSSTCVSRISNPAYRLLASDLDWLVGAGVTIAAYNVDEPCTPLEICKKRNLFKLFYNDVSLLTESPQRKAQTALDVLGLRTPARRGRITYLPIYMAGPLLNE